MKLHDLGVLVLACQKNILCQVKDCQRKKSFNSFSKLGQHLLETHREVMDKQSVNKTWKKRYQHDNNSKLISELKTKFRVGKRYQTRHGRGFLCNEHPDSSIQQSPEGLGRHWQKIHNRLKYVCPVVTCWNTDGSREEFTSVKRLYDHIKSHDQSCGKSATLRTHSPCEGGHKKGWLCAYELDFLQL